MKSFSSSYVCSDEQRKERREDRQDARVQEDAEGQGGPATSQARRVRQYSPKFSYLCLWTAAKSKSHTQVFGRQPQAWLSAGGVRSVGSADGGVRTNQPGQMTVLVSGPELVPESKALGLDESVLLCFGSRPVG